MSILFPANFGRGWANFSAKLYLIQLIVCTSNTVGYTLRKQRNSIACKGSEARCGPVMPYGVTSIRTFIEVGYSKVRFTHYGQRSSFKNQLCLDRCVHTIDHVQGTGLSRRDEFQRGQRTFSLSVSRSTAEL
jgi:hypothetical protein